MPFVQRNWKGEITGLYAQPQPQPDGTNLTEPDPLPDDHPEVVAYLAKNPVPPEFLKPLSKKGLQRLDARNKIAEKEHAAISRSLVIFNEAFTLLVIALSALLYACLNIRKSQIAYAIFYSPTSFDARIDIVENTVLQLALENKELAELYELWSPIDQALQKVRRLRNDLAHGAATTLHIRGKAHARYSAPPFDVVRVGRVIATGQIPGLKANEINAGIETVRWTADRIDQVNRIVTAFHDGDPTLPAKFATLRGGLTA